MWAVSFLYIRFNPLPAVKPGDANYCRQNFVVLDVSIHSRRLSREMLNLAQGAQVLRRVSIHSRRLSREMLAEPKLLQDYLQFQSTPGG